MGYREVLESLSRIALAEDPEEYVKNRYGEAGKKAIKAVREGRVARIETADGATIWRVRGRTRDYLVIPGRFCSCRGFTFLVARGARRPCYHLIAQAYAERTGFYRVVRVDKTAFEVVSQLL